MTDLVPTDKIEGIVGAKRDAQRHIGRAVSHEQVVYILHSQRCLDTVADLRECEYSLTLDDGIDLADWSGCEDRAVMLAIKRGRLVPAGCCDRCGGLGADMEGPCWDCRATGHPHPADGKACFDV